MLLINLLNKSSPEYKKTRKDALARKRTKAWRLSNPEKFKENNKKYRDPSKDRQRGFLKRYGITEFQIDRMWIEQKNRCAGCQERFAPGILYVDHCHKTGRVRGLLCSKCNFALGHVNDSPATLRRLAAYLEETDGR